MKKYVVKSHGDDIHMVVETSNENTVIKSYPNRTDAKKLAKHLNGGGGFNGFTPSFFLIEIPK